MFNSIVVATDGSNHAGRALEMAAELASRDNAALHIIYVVDSDISGLPEGLFEMSKSEHVINPAPQVFTDFRDINSEALKAAQKASQESQRLITQLAEHIVKDAARRADRAGAERVTTSIENGNPADAILSYAQKHNADAIVTGRRGQSALKSLFMGSTSMKVAQNTECTCITVK